MKGKKAYCVKKNVPCQTFFNADEAHDLLDQTKLFFDFFLHKIKPNLNSDLDAEFAPKIHPLEKTCFMLTCHPSLLNDNPSIDQLPSNLSSNSRSSRITYLKMPTKRKVYKVPRYFLYSAKKLGPSETPPDNDAPIEFCVASAENTLWLSSSHSTLAN